MTDQHVNADERVRALRRRALLAERLLLDLGGAKDRDLAAGMVVQALTAVGGSSSAQLLSWSPEDVRRATRAEVPPVDELGISAIGPDGDPVVVLARSTADGPAADGPGDHGRPEAHGHAERHHAVDHGHRLELVVEGGAVPPVSVDRALTALTAALDRIDVEERLLREARTDTLTGLLNRRAIDERIEGQLAQVERRGGQVSVLVIDLDGFKQVNDTLGHAAGDELLRGVAGCMTGIARAADDAARLGGDEFALLLPLTGRAGAHVVARRLAGELASLPHGVHASIGVATVEDAPVPTVAELLRWADTAMYEAKRDRERSIVHAAAPA